MKKLYKTKLSAITMMIYMLFKQKAVKAAVTFNQGQATSDVKNLLDPISNFMLAIALPVTLVTIGYAWLTWSGKDEAEKEQMPFHKVAKKNIIAFVIVGMTGAILKWFSIS